MAVLKCDGCGGDTFEPLSEPGYFRCENCGEGATVKLAVPTPASAAGRPGGYRLVHPGPKKIEVIKVMREQTGWGLKETKDFVDAATTWGPRPLPTNASSPEAVEYLAAAMRQAGAIIDQV